MKATELRIGNWVYSKSKKSEVQIYNGKDIDNAKDFEPISITEDWALRCGFDKIHRIGVGNFFSKTKLHIYVEEGRYISWRGQLTKCPMYVHSLQNFYKSAYDDELNIT
jgi:hypothetical protein